MLSNFCVTRKVFSYKMLYILLFEQTSHLSSFRNVEVFVEFNHPFLCLGISCFICKTSCVL